MSKDRNIMTSHNEELEIHNANMNDNRLCTVNTFCNMTGESEQNINILKLQIGKASKYSRNHKKTNNGATNRFFNIKK